VPQLAIFDLIIPYNTKNYVFQKCHSDEFCCGRSVARFLARFLKLTPDYSGVTVSMFCKIPPDYEAVKHSSDLWLSDGPPTRSLFD
jgi:hypothetical protein